jgi:hypothetical protein
MTDIQTLKMAVAKLPVSELQQFSEWFDEFISEQWDKKIEKDIFAGRLDALGEQAEAEFIAGRTEPL